MSAQIYNLPFYQVQTPIVLNSSFTLGWVPVWFLGYSFQAVWTGTPNGTFYLDGSSDKQIEGTDIIIPSGSGVPYFVKQGYQNPVRYNTITGSSYAVSLAGSNTWNVSGARYNFVRLGYTDGSGGTSTATLNFVNMLNKGPG